VSGRRVIESISRRSAEVLLRIRYQIVRFFRHVNVWVLISLLWLGLVLVRYRGELPPLRQFPWWDAISPPRLLWSRPAAAPNGRPWPAVSGYIPGYPRLNVSGHVDVTADNSGSLNDVLVKLYDRDRKPMVPVRVAFVRAKEKFTMAQVKPGHYDVRYLDLTTDQSPDQDTDIWCGADPSPPDGEKSKTICTLLSYFENSAGVVSPELRALIPADQNFPMVHVFPFTKSITLRIHDLDAEKRAALSARSISSGARPHRVQ